MIFGISTALNGGISLTSHWLFAAYGLLGLLVGANLYADHWMNQVARAAEATTDEAATPELTRWVRSTTPVWSLAAAGTITLAIVFVMVVKPDVFG